MTLDEARAHIGHGVIYAPELDPAEDGVITGVSDQYVFVRYRGSETPKATMPEALTLARATVEAGWEPRPGVSAVGHTVDDDEASAVIGPHEYSPEYGPDGPMGPERCDQCREDKGSPIHHVPGYTIEHDVPPASPVDLAAIRARYEENRRRRADAWRSMDDMGTLLDALHEEYVRGRAHHRDDLSGIEQHREAVERLTASRDRARQEAEAALLDVEHYRDRVAEAEAVAATCTCTPHPYGEGPEADCPVHGAVRTLNEVLHAAEGQQARVDAALTMHRGFHQCGADFWIGDDTTYKGAIAKPGYCPTYRVLTGEPSDEPS